MANFSERLSELIESKGIMKKSVAEFLGVTYRTINNYENGVREPSIDQLTKLADFFEVSIDYLTGRSDDPTPPTRDADKPEVDPADAAFFQWVQEHVTGMHFYDFQKAMEDQAWLKGLRVVYEKEKGRKPGQKQGDKADL